MTRIASRATKADHVEMAMYAAQVAATRHLTPHLKRITLASDDLRAFRDDGPDQRFKLLLPRAGQDGLVLPDNRENWYVAWKAMPDDVRPVMRTYTVRAARPDVGELDVDIVVHGDIGPGSRWATHARPGDEVGVFGAYAEYEADPDATQLIAGDHAALPAVAAIVEQLPSTCTASVVIEVPGPDERILLSAPDGVTVTWVDTRPSEPGRALSEAIREVLRKLPDYAWIAADSGTATGVRRYLVGERGMRSDQVMFMGYWRTDGAIDDD